jgi:hypothetical protein
VTTSAVCALTDHACVPACCCLAGGGCGSTALRSIRRVPDGYNATDRLSAIGGAPEGLLQGDPADFGKIVAFLCSEPAGFVSGAALQVDDA